VFKHHIPEGGLYALRYHSLVFVDQMAGLPTDEELEREIAAAAGEPYEPPAPAAEAEPAIPARFLRKSTGWK